MTEHQNIPAPIPSASLAPQMQPYGVGALEEEKPGGLGLKRYLHAVLRHKWLILALAVVGTSVGWYASRLVQLRYTAQANIWLDSSSPVSAGGGPIRSSQLLRTDAWVDLMKSYRVMDYVVREQRLYLSYATRDTAVMSTFALDSMFRPGAYRLVVDAGGSTVQLRTEEGQLLETVPAGQAVGKKLGFLWVPPRTELAPKRQVKFEVVPPRDASKQLEKTLDVRITRNGQFMRVTYGGDNPTLVAAVVNSTINRYVEVAAELKRAKHGEMTDILEGQLVLVESKLREAEYALQNFQVQTITLPTEPTTPVPGSGATQGSLVSTYFGIKIQRDGIQRDREAIERAMAGDSISLDAMSTVSSAHASPEFSAALSDITQKRAGLRALRQQYTDEHTLVRRALADIATVEKEVIPQLGRKLIAELREREADLDAQAAASSTELRSIPPRIIEEGRLRRTVATTDKIFGELLARVESARLSAVTSVPDVSILDAAVVPRRPAMDQRMKLVFMAFAASLGLGLALAVLLDMMDPRLRYAEQVTNDLGLTIIGAVPSIGQPRRKLLGGTPEGPQVLEALRSIRLGLMNAYGSAGPIMMTITSPGSGDGKTFITSNLGLAFADLGLKTLLIDGDTRRGTLHRLFTIERKPGLTDYLNGTTALSAESILHHTKFGLVDVIPSGTRRGNAPELLSSGRMGDLLAQIRGEYDVILIDSPPLGAGVDALVLGSLTANILMIMRTGITDRGMAEAKLKMLDRLPIRLLGTILNGFDAADSFHYYSYMPGYESGHEDAANETADLLQPA